MTLNLKHIYFHHKYFFFTENVTLRVVAHELSCYFRCILHLNVAMFPQTCAFTYTRHRVPSKII